jgi:SSS family solute:Na+ symporter
MIAGAIFAVAAFILYQIKPDFPVNAMVMSFLSSQLCIMLYIAVSLLNSDKPFDLDKMLHRGPYAPADAPPAKPNTWLTRLGITSEFTKFESFIALGMCVWSIGWCVVAITATIYYFTFGISFDGWITFWKIYIGITFSLGLVIIIWLAVGGIRDLKFLFNKLATAQCDEHDDGMILKEPPQEAGTGKTDAAPKDIA